MILKVKEPIEVEYNKIKANQIVFTYFHFASNKNLTRAMLNNKMDGLLRTIIEPELRKVTKDSKELYYYSNNRLISTNLSKREVWTNEGLK